jgi:trimeric autotransporter adhesin
MMRFPFFYFFKRTYMHKFVASGAGLLACATALAQQYSIITVAGGAPPATPISATNISIGQPSRTTTDSAGNVYFSAGNCVFKMTPSGTLTLVAGNSRAGFSGDGGPANAAMLNGPRGLVLDGAGNLYIADSRNNRVRIVSPNGTINTFAGNGQVSPGGGPGVFGDGGPATAANLHLPSGVAVDSSGDIYIADTADNIIREVTTDGIINTIAGDSFPGFLGDTGQAINAELYAPEDIALDSSGNIYIADTQNGRIRQINTSGVINTYAGDGTIGYAGDGGAGTSAEIWAPVALAVDSSGDVYFVENGDSRIRMIKASTTFASDIASGTAPVSGTISTVAGNGTAGFFGDGSTATNAEMNFPSGVALDTSGNLYVADALNLRIRKISGSNISSVAGNGVLSYSGDGGAAIAAQMNAPQATAVDSSGNLYIADTANNVVRKVTRDGVIHPFAGNGSAGFGGDGGAATSAQLRGPRGLAVDSSGNLYIADSNNNRVRMVAPSGTITTVAGNGTAGYGGDGGAGASAELYTPVGVSVDGSGNLYIADLNNQRIRMVSAGSGIMTTVAGTGNAGYSGDGGPATSAQLNYPIGVAVDSGANIYIADSANYVIRKVLSGGQIYTIAGNGLSGYSGDGGQAVSAQIGSPAAVAADSTWNVYFTDGSSHVRKVFTSGYIVTIAGNGTVGYSGDGGPAANAQLNVPEGLSIDSQGNVYVADSANNAVRELQPLASGIAITAIVSAASNQSNPVSPGDLVTIYGSGLGPTGTVYQLVNGMVPETLSGTTVYFNNAAAPILYASTNQINVVVPFGIQGTTAQVVVNYLGQNSAPQTVNVVAAAPALFTLNATGSGQAAALNQDFSVNGPSNPAKAGSYIILYGTGAGLTNPPSQDGAVAAVPLPLPVLPITVTIGGQSATTSYAGAAPALVDGVIQINATVPSGLGSGSVAVPVVMQINGSSSQNGVTIWVTN